MNNGDGSALMRDPDRAGLIIRRVCDAVPVPVTVKFRKGWDSGSVNAVEFARMAEESGLSLIHIFPGRKIDLGRWCDGVIGRQRFKFRRSIVQARTAHAGEHPGGQR